MRQYRTSIIGKYTLTDVAPGDYVLEIARAGFLPRYGRISVSSASNPYIGHREILAGDINNDLTINDKDLSAIRTRVELYGSPIYDSRYDFNGDKQTNNVDVDVIRVNLGASVLIYQETVDLY